MCIVALRVGVQVESCTVVFLEGYFLFTSSDSNCGAGCIVQPQHRANNEPLKFPRLQHADSHGLRGQVTINCARHFGGFGSAAIPYDVRSAIGLLSDSYASCSYFYTALTGSRLGQGASVQGSLVRLASPHNVSQIR